LTGACSEGCAFCYARAWRATGAAEVSAARLLAEFDHYARLLATAGPAPSWRPDAPEGERLRVAAGVVNLLGGEPTEHSELPALVRGLRALGLGVNLFTNGAHPERVRTVAEHLWFVTINGRFIARAPSLGWDLARTAAQVPLRPGDDPEVLLEAVAAAGVRSAILAFAAPAGGAFGPFFTPDDLPALHAVYARARAAGTRLGLALAWDCAFPRCLDPLAGAAACLPVPVLDAQGLVGACGGAYHGEPRRPLTSFTSLADLHAFTAGIHAGLRARPHAVAACAACPLLGAACQGMCLAFRR
jgi:hypothetical protein